jgi:hypothetical protein
MSTPPSYESSEPIFAQLSCVKCGRRIACNVDTAVDYELDDSWPTCCGQTMRLVCPIEGTRPRQSVDEFS